MLEIRRYNILGSQQFSNWIWYTIFSLVYSSKREKGSITEPKILLLPAPPQYLPSVHTEKLDHRLSSCFANDKGNYFFHLSSLPCCFTNIIPTILFCCLLCYLLSFFATLLISCHIVSWMSRFFISISLPGFHRNNTVNHTYPGVFLHGC